MAKRSPILGYNHNVRYRGLVFHVQTEDSGLLSPHLFTHLFYSGVIISTRKLVYDAGSAEDAIKSLMQAQHKAVMKDLKRGHFDDKIDVYLKDTPGLLPRGASPLDTSPGDTPVSGDEPRLARPSEPIAPVAAVDAARAETRERMDSSNLPMALKPTKLDVGDAALPARTQTPVRGSPDALPAQPRTKTADRTSKPSTVRSSLPPDAGALDAPTLNDASGSVTDPIYGATTRNNIGDGRAEDSEDSNPEIEIQLELEAEDDDPPPTTSGRARRDTDLAVPGNFELDDRTRRNLSDGIPGMFAGGESQTRPSSDSVPPQTQTSAERARSSLGAASLPPARPITRPPSRPAMSPPQVVSRPVTASDDRQRRESDAIELYSPAPPSADLPPGAGSERPGQYAQHSRRPLRSPTSEQVSARPATVPVPAGLGRPGRGTNSSNGVPRATGREESGATRPRSPTPPRPTSPSRPASNSGVVMTRPAVIVGAPSKPVSTPQRVRKAREDEGRGFGQGLISEKSLDEVILAYLSEDADDK